MNQKELEGYITCKLCEGKQVFFRRVILSNKPFFIRIFMTEKDYSFFVSSFEGFSESCHRIHLGRLKGNNKGTFDAIDIPKDLVKKMEMIDTVKAI